MSRIFSNSSTTLGIIEDLEIAHLKQPVYPLRSHMEDIEDLADSIMQKGLLQPLVIRISDTQSFEIVAGCRRYHACKMLGWRKIPCHVVELDERESFEVSLMENLQRNSLNVLDEARAYKKYVVEFGWGGVTELAKKTGKSTSYITKKIQLLDLPKAVLTSIENSSLSPSIAEELHSVKDLEKQAKLAEIIADNKLSFRKSRKLLQEQKIFQDKLLQTASLSLQTEKAVRVLDRAIVALRIAMTRIGTMAENFEDDLVLKTLMHHKNMLHEQIGMLIKEKKQISKSR